MTATTVADDNGSIFQRNTFIVASDLRPKDIGQTVRIRVWDNTTEIATVITAELRQFSCNGNVVHVNLGLGAGTEVTMDHDQPVTLRPT